MNKKIAMWVKWLVVLLIYDFDSTYQPGDHPEKQPANKISRH